MKSDYEVKANMDIRYSCNQRDFKRYTTEETRNEFLITGLYKADEVVSVYSHVDRMVTFGCMPVNEVVPLDKGLDVWANFGTGYVLEPGSNWNSMPSHTHERRMEIYTYFEVPENQVVIHMMGEPTETRHLVMKNYDAVISPSWSIHSGVGTSNYAFIWAMGGENQEFDDMDTIATTELK